MDDILPRSSLEEKFAANMNNILGVNKVDQLGVAVSGGSDSVALLHLVAQWAEINNIKVTIFSVDHNLRAESKLEISYIEKLSEKFKFNFVPLSWICGDQITAMQERARKARYELMSQNCKKLKIPLLLTAHHFDDMLETYLIKKSKKTGDLALLANITYFWDDLWVVRPLFNIEKKELVAYLQKNKISWFEDQSNKLNKYERNRIRKKIATFTEIEKAKLSDEYNESVNRAKLLNQIFIESLAELVSIYNYGFAKINVAKFSDLTQETKISVINHVLTIISGGTTLPRYRSLDKIIALIDSNLFKSSTLNRCKLILRNGDIIIYKEKIFVEKGHSSDNLICDYIYNWDDRFEIIFNNEKATYNTKISNLTMEDYIKLRKHLNLKKLAKDSNNNHKSILFTLPVIKNLEKVVAIPHISYYDNETLSGAITINFKPRFVSRFTHFF